MSYFVYETEILSATVCKNLFNVGEFKVGLKP